MDERATERPPAGRSPLLSALLLLGIFGWGVLLRFAPLALWTDLVSEMDSLEAVSVATNLVEGRGWGLFLDGAVYPPINPPGLPLWMAFFSAVGGGGFMAMALSVWLPASTGILFVHAIGARLFGWEAGIFAALVLAMSPMHVSYSQMVAPDALLATGCVAAFFGAVSIEADGRRSAFAWGIFVALLVYLRFYAILLLPALVVTLFLRFRREALPLVIAASIGGACALLPLAVHHQRTFGRPWESGYGYWVPDTQSYGSGLFRLAYATAGWDQPQGNLPMYLDFLLRGWEGADLFGPTLWICILAGSVSLARRGGREAGEGRALMGGSLVFVLLLLAFFSCYRFWCPRRLLPALYFFALLAGLGARDLVHALVRRLRIRRAVPLVVLLLLPLLGLMVAGERGSLYTGNARALFEGRLGVLGTSRWLPLMAFLRSELPPGALFLSDEDDQRFRLFLEPFSQLRHFPAGGTAHLDRIVTFRLSPPGAPFRKPRQLVLGGRVDEDALAEVLGEVRRGRPVFWVTGGRLPEIEEQVRRVFRLGPERRFGKWRLRPVSGSLTGAGGDG